MGAKSALGTDSLQIETARDLTSAWNDIEIHASLLEWSKRYADDPTGLRSLAVVFAGPTNLNEAEFERAMWERLQSLTDKDAWRASCFTRSLQRSHRPPFFFELWGAGIFCSWVASQRLPLG